MTRCVRNIGRGVLAVYVIAVLCLCLGTFQGPSGMWKTFLGIQMDKVFHFLLYLPYPALAFWAFYPKKNAGRFLLIVLLIGIAYSGAVEIMQALFTDNRSAEWGDLLANTLGMAAGAMAVSPALLFLRRRAK
ncbi:MAG: VanZ family protein [Bacteroidales bacterium]|nr:VanZ family protein [Bacteroidales bacterium]